MGKLRENNRRLEERLAEERIACLDLEDSFYSLRLSTNAKLRHLAKAMGKEDILFPPSP
jgi:hypothetical protein